MLTLSEAIQQLRISRSTMYRLIKAGQITPIRFSSKGAYRFDPDELQKLTTQAKNPRAN